MNAFSGFRGHNSSLRAANPLTDDQIARVAPSIFAEHKHGSRSDRYTVIPTIEVLTALRKEGFSPFMVCQTKSRDEEKRGHAKHMIRMRHESKIQNNQANEIILLNSHDGSSSYRMIAGVFRFVCSNGMVVGDIADDIRIRHSGDVIDNVIEGAFRVLDDFQLVDMHREAMQSLTLNVEEQHAFAQSALTLKYDLDTAPAPITTTDLLRPKRIEDQKTDLWTTFNRVQENMIKGGIRSRSKEGKVSTTREVKGIDQNIKLNRALWTLAEAMRKIKN
ncbi:MAG: DUF945 domain-containing protein [Sphingobacteriaceae bacterium]|nr:DUF945 domain-containing protein [Sphingobacteriaceae bacterium]